MEEEILGAEEQFIMSVQCSSLTPQEQSYNQAIIVLQDIMMDDKFQKLQNNFVNGNFVQLINSESHYGAAGSKGQDSTGLVALFQKYQIEISSYLQQKIKQKIKDFDLQSFFKAIQKQREKIDPIVYELVSICVNFEDFVAFFEDYKKQTQEEERYRVLTVKTNKIPQNKKVKGNLQNIFANSNQQLFGGKPKKVSQKQKTISQKNQFQLLVPSTVLTVKGLRKG